MPINTREMESLQKDLEQAHFDIVTWRSKKSDQYDVKEFHKKVTLRLAELVTVAQNLERAGNRRAF